MHYVRKKGSSKGTGSGARAAETFKQAWRESAAAGDVKRSESESIGEGEPSAEAAQVLRSAGYAHRGGGRYELASERGTHRVVVTRESLGGFQAKVTPAYSPKGYAAYYDTLDAMEAGIPRMHREASRPIGTFWADYAKFLD